MVIPFGLIAHFAKLAYETYAAQKRITDSYCGAPSVGGGKMFLGIDDGGVVSGAHGHEGAAGLAISAWLEKEYFKISSGRTSIVHDDGSLHRIGTWSSDTYEYREDEELKYKAKLVCVPGNPDRAGFFDFKLDWEKARDPCFPFAHSIGVGWIELSVMGVPFCAPVYAEWMTLGLFDDQFRPQRKYEGEPYAKRLIAKAWG